MHDEASNQTIGTETAAQSTLLVYLAGAAFVGATLALVAVAWVVMWWASVRLSPDPVRDAQIAAVEAQEREAARLVALGPPGPALDLNAVARGQRLYDVACFACHGTDGRGKPNLGKDLVGSAWARRKTDVELAKLVIAGRPVDDPLNTTKVPMPARGGRADFGDGDIADVIAYVRSLQDPRRVNGPLPADVKVAVLDVVDEPVTPAAKVASAGPIGDGSSAIGTITLDAQAIGRGKRVFASCMACHGKNGLGVPKTGADLVHSGFVKAKSDEDLVAFIKKGRQPGDADSKLNLTMPAKGGNPSLKDNQIQDVVVYLRSLQQAAADTK